MKVLVRALLIVLLVVQPAQSRAETDERSLSLEEALAIAAERSYQVGIFREQLSYARGRRTESLKGFLPQVRLSETYMRSDDPVSVFSMKLKQGVFTQADFDLDVLNTPDELDNFATAVHVQQPILNVEAIYGTSAARMGVKAGEAALQRSREAVALAVRRGYYGLILARQNLEAIDGAVHSAKRHRDDAKAALDQGMINEADYLGAEVRLAELEEQRITAANDIINASDALKFVMGLKGDGLIVPTEDIAVPEMTLPEESGDVIDRRADVVALRYQASASRRQLWVARGDWIPRLNAFGGVEWNADKAFDTHRSNWTIGVSLEWKIFDGLGTVGRSGQAAAQAAESELRYREAEHQARIQVRRAARAVTATRERMQVAERAVGQAEESLRVIEQRYKQGIEKTSDLLDKEVALTNARLRYLRARHDHAIAVSEMRFAMGM